MDFLTWEQGGTILSSMKRYQPLIRRNGRISRAAVIGAVYTPARFRRKGYASAMIRAVLEQAREAGTGLALLFTDIGTAYYRSLGFHVLPATMATARRIPARPPVSGPVGFSPADAAHLSQVRNAHEACMRPYDLHIVRDQKHWDFLLARADHYFSRASATGHQRFRAAHRAGRFLGYLVDIQADGEWEIREVGAADGKPETMAEILRAAAGVSAGRKISTAYGWLPQALIDALPEWDWTVLPRDRAIPMIASTGGPEDSDPPAGRLNSFFPYMDQF
jgi:GNAT superfamily N-acetyltransferase